MSDQERPVGWRDVYKLVGDTKEDILSAIRDLQKATERVTDDHEDRLRELEKSDQRRSGALAASKMFIAALAAAVGALASFAVQVLAHTH